MNKHPKKRPAPKRLRTLTRRRQPSGPAPEKYSRFVRMMRLLLPLVALGILSLVLAWPRLQNAFSTVKIDESLPRTAGKNELIQPNFKSIDDSGQPFNITAHRALQSANDPSLVLLERPMADITMKNGTWIAVEAQNGTYRQNSEKLLLEGNVKLYHDAGYQLETSKLLVNLMSREAWSDQPVSAQGPAGTLEASGMKVGGNMMKIVFTGPATLKLNKGIEGL